MRVAYPCPPRTGVGDPSHVMKELTETELLFTYDYVKCLRLNQDVVGIFPDQALLV